MLTAFLTLALTAPPADSPWALVFEDTFDGATLNGDVWSSQNGPSGHILSSRWKENVEVKDGLLRLVTRKEQRAGQEWTSGNIWTTTARFGYGYFEARYRYGAAPGLNNAFWLFQDVKHITPGEVEIDINEGHYPDEVNTNLHLHSDGPGRRHIGFPRSWRAAGADLSREFHVYGLEWTAQELVFYFDDKPIRRLPNLVAHNRNMRLFFSSAVLGWAGEVTDALDQTAMEVDWVRVWERRGPEPAPPANPPLVDASGGRERRMEVAGNQLQPVIHRGAAEVTGAVELPGLVWRREADMVLALPETLAPGRPAVSVVQPDTLVALPFPPARGRVEVTADLFLATPYPALTVGLGAPALASPAPRLTTETWAFAGLCGPYLHLGEGPLARGYWADGWHGDAALPVGRWCRLRFVVDTVSGRWDMYLDDAPAPVLGGEFRAPQAELGSLVLYRRSGVDDAHGVLLGGLTAAILAPERKP